MTCDYGCKLTLRCNNARRFRAHKLMDVWGSAMLWITAHVTYGIVSSQTAPVSSCQHFAQLASMWLPPFQGAPGALAPQMNFLAIDTESVHYAKLSCGYIFELTTAFAQPHHPAISI